MSKEVRLDITGLRALAVIFVLLYHFLYVLEPDGNFFRGGYIGLDIFLVIAGYLTTSVIFTAFNQGTFNLFQFYYRRIKRLCPALLAVVVVFVTLWAIFFHSSEIKRVAMEGVMALIFGSNYYFAYSVDSPSTGILQLPFLHTWILSVEFQFFIIYPFIVMALRSFCEPRYLARTFLLITIGLCALSLYHVMSNPVNSYYMLHSRLFEFFVGALAYFYPLSYFQKHFKPKFLGKKKDKEERQFVTVAEHHNRFFDHFFNSLKPWMVELAGLVLICLSVIFVDDKHGWPNFWVMLPLFGTYLCLAANNSQRSCLRFAVFQYIGRWSFSIYLVHWPLTSLLVSLGFDPGSFEFLIPIFILAALLYYLVESRREYGPFLLSYYSIAAMVISLLMSVPVQNLMRSSVVEEAQQLRQLIPEEGQINAIGDTTRPVDFILVGDRVARNFAAGLMSRNLHVVTVFREECYSFGRFVSYHKGGLVDPKCAMLYSNVKDAANKYKDVPIVFALDWNRYKGRLITRSSSCMYGSEYFEEFLSRDFAQLLREYPERNLYIFGSPRQVVYEADSTCLFLQSQENFLSKLHREHYVCNVNKHNACVNFNKRIEYIVNTQPQDVVNRMHRSNENWLALRKYDERFNHINHHEHEQKIPSDARERYEDDLRTKAKQVANAALMSPASSKGLKSPYAYDNPCNESSNQPLKETAAQGRMLTRGDRQDQAKNVQEAISALQGKTGGVSIQANPCERFSHLPHGGVGLAANPVLAAANAAAMVARLGEHDEHDTAHTDSNRAQLRAMKRQGDTADDEITPTMSFDIDCEECQEQFAKRRLKFIDPDGPFIDDKDSTHLIGNMDIVFQDGLHYVWTKNHEMISYMLDSIGVEQGAEHVDEPNHFVVATKFSSNPQYLVNSSRGMRSHAPTKLMPAGVCNMSGVRDGEVFRQDSYMSLPNIKSDKGFFLD